MGGFSKTILYIPGSRRGSSRYNCFVHIKFRTITTLGRSKVHIMCFIGNSRMCNEIICRVNNKLVSYCLIVVIVVLHGPIDCCNVPMAFVVYYQ